MELEIDERALAVTLLLRLSGAACLAVCLFICLSLCLAKDGATAIIFSFDDTFQFLSSFLFLS